MTNETRGIVANLRPPTSVPQYSGPMWYRVGESPEMHRESDADVPMGRPDSQIHTRRTVMKGGGGDCFFAF